MDSALLEYVQTVTEESFVYKNLEAVLNIVTFVDENDTIMSVYNITFKVCSESALI